MLSSLLREKESAETHRCRSSCKSSISTQRNSKGEQAEKNPFLKALEKRNPKSSMHSTMLLVFPIVFWVWFDLRWLHFIYLEHSRPFSIWIFWCWATDSSSLGCSWRLFPLTNCSSQLTPCSVTSPSNRAKTDQRVQKLFGRGVGVRETHTQKLQEVSFFSWNQRRNQFSPFV